LPDQQTFRQFLRELARSAIRVVLEGVMCEKLAPGYEFMLSIKGLQGLLTDPRAPQIVASLLKFRPCTGFVLALTESDDRISFRNGGRVAARVGGARLTSPATTEMTRLATLPQGVSLSVLFDRMADARDTV
jgi:hypothetical protein